MISSNNNKAMKIIQRQTMTSMIKDSGIMTMMSILNSLNMRTNDMNKLI